jgi:hypothetical protein
MLKKCAKVVHNFYELKLFQNEISEYLDSSSQ